MQGYTAMGVSRTPHGRRVQYPRTRALDLLQIKKKRRKREAEKWHGVAWNSDDATPATGATADPYLPAGGGRVLTIYI